MLGSTICVVLVDSSAVIRRNIREYLAGADDIRVTAEADNGPEALDLVVQHQPDVVVLDAHMPGQNCVETVRQLRSQGSTVGILILVLSEDSPSIKLAIDAGANGYALQSSPIEEVIEAMWAVHEANQVLVQIGRRTRNDLRGEVSRNSTP